VSVEAASSFGWARYAHAHVAIDHFGASAPGDVNMREFGFTAENVAETALKLLG
jgi:transketolase